MANEKKTKPEDYYVHYTVSKGKQFSLFLAITLFFIIFSYLLFMGKLNNQYWLITAIPIIICGLILASFPITENWEYKPWQNSPTKMEQHFLD